MFIALLLYSESQIRDEKERSLYNKIRTCITDTEFLRLYLFRICIDNTYSKKILKANKVTEWPCFVIRDNSEITLYELHQANEVFAKVHQQYKKFYPNAEDIACPVI